MKRVDLKTLSSDLPNLKIKEIEAMIMPFLIYSNHCKTNEYFVPEMREACNMCIRELIERGVDEEEIVWRD